MERSFHLFGTSSRSRLARNLVTPYPSSKCYGLHNFLVFWEKVQSEELAETLESVGATGGVYKGQGRNQHELMTHAY